jgi:hypothetical protein
MSTRDETEQALQRLSGFLGSSLGEVYASASAVDEPAGSSPSWDMVRAKWGVTPLSEEERTQIRAGTRPTRGAPVMEVQAVVSAIVARARYELGAVRTAAYHYDLDRPFDHLRRAVEEGENDVMSAYRTLVLPKRGGMFANATAHASGAPKPQGAASAVLLCRTCGAPQLKAEDFMCKYCGNRMA